MLDSILDEVVSSVKAQGINACRSFPEGGSQVRRSPCVVVSCDKTVCISSGFGEYLGVRSGYGGESDVELYGKRLKCQIGLAVYAPFGEQYGADFCVGCAEGIRSAANVLPSGIRVSEIEFGEVFVDTEVSAYCMKCSMCCTSYFIAESGDESGEFLDFVLKGTVLNEY